MAIKINTIISIGYLGDYYNYLNITEEEAIKRWKKSNDWEEGMKVPKTQIHQCDDEWSSYDGAY